MAGIVSKEQEKRPLDLTGVKILGTSLRGADLTNASLRRANLRGVDFTDAIMRGADMAGAILEDAILDGADLTDAKNLTSEQVKSALVTTRTKLPRYLQKAS